MGGGHKYSQGNEQLQKAARGFGPHAGYLGLLTGVCPRETGRHRPYLQVRADWDKC